MQSFFQLPLPCASNQVGSEAERAHLDMEHIRASQQGESQKGKRKIWAKYEVIAPKFHLPKGILETRSRPKAPPAEYDINEPVSSLSSSTS